MISIEWAEYAYRLRVGRRNTLPIIAPILDQFEAGDAFDPQAIAPIEIKPPTPSVMRGKRRVRSLPGRLYSCTRLPSLRAINRKPSRSSRAQITRTTLAWWAVSSA
jgi:hypothetical protein